MLISASEEDVADLTTWLDEHPAAEDMKEAGIDPATKGRLDALFGKIRERDKDAYPCYTPVPLDLVPVLDWVIDDWCEVLASHDEGFSTELTCVEA